MPVILFIFCFLLLISTAQQLLSDMIFPIYLQKTTRSYAMTKVTKKETKTVLGEGSFQESVHILFHIQQNSFQKETFKSIFNTSLEDQDKIRDLQLQPVSNGCQINSLNLNAWVNSIVTNSFLEDTSKSSSHCNAVFSTDIF